MYLFKALGVLKQVVKAVQLLVLLSAWMRPCESVQNEVLLQLSNPNADVIVVGKIARCHVNGNTIEVVVVDQLNGTLSTMKSRSCWKKVGDEMAIVIGTSALPPECGAPKHKAYILSLTTNGADTCPTLMYDDGVYHPILPAYLQEPRIRRQDSATLCKLMRCAHTIALIH